MGADPELDEFMVLKSLRFFFFFLKNKSFLSLHVLLVLKKMEEYLLHESQYSRNKSLDNLLLSCLYIFFCLKESYCEVLHRYKEELLKPFDEATTFLSNIESQLSNLCKGALTKTLDYRSGKVFNSAFSHLKMIYLPS